MEQQPRKPNSPASDQPEGLHIDARQEPLVGVLMVITRLCVRALAVLMTLVIIWSVADVGWIFYQRLMGPPVGLLTVEDILVLFSAFMITLIAIEILLNIVLYLRDDVVHVKMVLATALMAIARKVIVLDYKTMGADYIWATAAVVLALSIGYWLVAKNLNES